MKRIFFATLLIFAVALTIISQTNSNKPPPRKPSPISNSAVAEGYFTGSDGVRLFYRSFGDGKDAAVFIHGGPGLNMNDGGCYFEPLAKGRTLIMYDQRGGGRSQLITDPKLLTESHHVRDLEALRQHFRIERMTIIGLSWGTGLAALYAAEYPQRVKRMLLVGPMPLAKTPYADERREKVNALLGSVNRARMDEILRLIREDQNINAVALCREWFSIAARPYLVNPANWSLERCDRCDVPPTAIRNRGNIARATLGSIGDWDFRPLLAKLEMPVLVIEGAETKVPLDSTRGWAEALPNARLLLIRNAGHLAPVEQPTVFRNAVDRFLRGNFPKEAEVVRKSGAGNRKS